MRRPARRWRGWRWLHPKGGSMPEPPEHDNRRGKTHLVSLSAAGAARAPWNLHLLAALVRRDFKAQYRRSLIGPAWAILYSGIYLLLFIRSEEHTSELQSLMRISYAVFCLKKNKKYNNNITIHHSTLIQQ